MSKIEEIVDNYYEAIQEYEKYFEGTKLDEKEYDDSKTTEEPLIGLLNKELEKKYLPWRSLKGNIKSELLNIFETKDFSKVASYLRIEDEVSDALTISAKQDLIKYYSKNGYDINDDEVLDKIIEEACQISFKNSMDANIYSIETICIFFIDKKITNACNELYKYCTGYYDEVEKEI